MPTEQIELTTGQTELIAGRTELIDKLNCLEYESAQLNRAYQLWRSCVEQGTAPDWMVAATRVTYDALINFYLQVSAILSDGPHAFSARSLAQFAAPRDISGIVREESTAEEWSPGSSGSTELTTEQIELIEKLNCLEYESAQLNRAYQLWTSYVEQGKAPDWMVGVISISYDALITFCLEVSTILADGPQAFSANHSVQLAAQPSPRLLPMREPDWSEPPPEMPAVTIAPSNGHTSNGHSNGHTNSELPNIQEEEEAEVPRLFSARLLLQLKAAGYEVSDNGNGAYEVSEIMDEASTTAEPSQEYLPMTESEWSEPEIASGFSQSSTDDEIWEESSIEQDQQEEETTTEELSSELLPMREQPDWSSPPAHLAKTALVGGPGPEMPAAISPPLLGAGMSEQQALLQAQQEEEEGVEPATIRSLATVAADWLQGSSTGILFFVPPGVMGKIIKATSVAVLTVAGGTTGIYLFNARRAALKSEVQPVQNSVGQAAAGVVAIPTGEKAGFKFDPDPAVAVLGRNFVLNAVLSRGSDVASMAIQIDYDANLLQFTGVTAGGFLAREGQKAGFVLAQKNDPAAGVVRISAEKSPGNPGLSGDGPVFALSFQARKRGKATVSIVPGAHDSMGRRIEMAGSQVSVKVN